MKIEELKIYLNGAQPTGVISLDICIGVSEKVIGKLCLLKTSKGVFNKAEPITLFVELESWNKHVVRLRYDQVKKEEVAEMPSEEVAEMHPKPVEESAEEKSVEIDFSEQ